jgi:hypothetical protein
MRTCFGRPPAAIPVPRLCCTATSAPGGERLRGQGDRDMYWQAYGESGPSVHCGERSLKPSTLVSRSQSVLENVGVTLLNPGLAANAI